MKQEEQTSKEENTTETPEQEVQDNEVEVNENLITEEEVNKLKQELENAKDDFLRERAEFINYRKRSSQEKIELDESITGRILTSFIPALDAFDQLFAIKLEADATNSSVALQKFIDGARLIQKQFMNGFTSFGVTEFEPINLPFDPNTMEALHVQESETVKETTVQSVYQKGYKIKEKVIRAARVAVVKPIEQKTEKSVEENNEDK